MAAINYHGILTSLDTIFKADARTSYAATFVERDPQLGLADLGSAIAMFLDSRVATAEQAMAAGKRTRYLLSVAVWVIGFDVESFEKAALKRDTLLGQVELVLMDNRTISGKVTASQLSGGEFSSAMSDSGTHVFCALAKVTLQAEVSAINP